MSGPASVSVLHAREQPERLTSRSRRVDLNIAEPLANGYRFGEALKFFEKRIPVAPEASPGLKMIAAGGDLAHGLLRVGK